MFCCCPQPDEDDLMSDMDRWTKKLVSTLVPSLMAGEPVTEQQLEQPRGTGPQPLIRNRVGRTVFINLRRDPSFGRFPLGAWAGLNFLHNPIFFPLMDVIVDISDDDVPKLLEQTQLDKLIPKPNVVFENPESDEAMTRQAFYGLAAHRVKEVTEALEKPGVAYKVDLLSMSALPVRSGFVPYGACAYFDADLNVHSIELPGGVMTRPGDGDKWQHAKFVWRSSLLTIVTAVDHLYNNHFGVASQMLRASTVALPEKHKVRRALQPFLMRTALVNNQAGEALLPRESMVHHITSLTWGALKDLAAIAYKKGPEWKPLPTIVKDKGDKIQKLIQDGKLPLYEDGLELYNAFVHYWDLVLDQDVENDRESKEFWCLLMEYTESTDLPPKLSREALLHALSSFSYRVTAGHEHVGSVAEHIETPVHGAFRIRPDSTRADKQSFVGLSTLMALTAIRTPPLQSSFEDYWSCQEEKDHWQALQEKLKVVEQNIDKRNKSRPYQVVSANPRILECAVSV